MRTKLIVFIVTIVSLCSTGFVWADLANEFAGYTATWEVAVSGLKSSYHSDTKSGKPISGTTVSNSIQTLGPNRVSYPSGVGTVPSPGGTIGQNFDQGVLGVTVQGNQLVVGLAGSLNPQTGYYHNGWEAWYGQGDVFLTVQDTLGVRHFALLSAWPRDGSGIARILDDGHFNDAQAFHLSGGDGGTSLEGHLVELGLDSDVALTGGRGSYNISNAPDGLDIRGYAQGGTDLGNTGLTHSSTTDYGLLGTLQTWYLQTWTVDFADLSTDNSFLIGLHSTPSCGNDSIGLGTEVSPIPAPGAAILGWLGMGVVGWVKRRLA